MGDAELLTARSAQDEPVWVGMAFSERVQMAVHEEHSDFISQKVRNLTRMSASSTQRPTSARSTSSRAAASTG